MDDPYNLYFSPDGQSAIVVAEARRRLDFRDPHTMALQYSIDTPECGGINHADFSIDGRYALFTCEFDGSVAKVDLLNRTVVGYLKLAMPGTRFEWEQDDYSLNVQNVLPDYEAEEPELVVHLQPRASFEGEAVTLVVVVGDGLW